MNFDISINITRPFIPRHTGHRSKYVNTEHPGSGNKIKGWQWDKYIWPSYSELSPFSYIPTLFDLKLNLQRVITNLDSETKTTSNLKNFV